MYRVNAPSVIILLLSLVSLSPNSFGQNFSLGVKAGPSITTGRFNDSDLRDIYSNKIKIGYTVGGFISFPLAKDYTFVAETGFSRKGKKLKIKNEGWINNASFNFIDFSMALRKSFNYQIRPDIRSKIFFNIGPNIEYWLNGKGKLEVDGSTREYVVVFDPDQNTVSNSNFYENPNRWLFGIDFGVGMDAPITPTQRVTAELRFTFGQTNLGKDNSASNIDILGFQDDLRMNLKTLSLTVGYAFGFDLKESKMGKSTKDKIIKRRKRR